MAQVASSSIGSKNLDDVASGYARRWLAAMEALRLPSETPGERLGYPLLGRSTRGPHKMITASLAL